MPAGTALDHSLVLGELLVAKDVVETASSSGEAYGMSLEVDTAGFISGDRTGGGERLSEEGFLSMVPLL
jgi:hypothetical protein